MNIEDLLKKLDKTLQLFCPKSKLLYYNNGALPLIEVKFDQDHRIKEIYPYIGIDRTFKATIPSCEYKLTELLDSKIPIFASYNCENNKIEDIYIGDYEKNIAFKKSAKTFVTRCDYEQYKDYKFGIYNTSYSILYKNVKTKEIKAILGGWRIDNPQHEDIKNLILG